MKKVIRGLRYNTDTAKKVGSDSYSNYGDLQYWSEELYRTSQGNWFLYGEGGALSKYARNVGQNETAGGEGITPLTWGEALVWLETHTSDADTFEEYFRDGIKDA